MELLRLILNQEFREGRIDRDPIKAVRPVPQQKQDIDPYSPEDLEKVLAHEVLGPVETAVVSAEDIHRAPFFVGAYFANVIHGIEHNQKPDCISDSIWKQVNEKWRDGKRNEALIIAYNPHAEQVLHIKAQLKILQENPD